MSQKNVTEILNKLFKTNGIEQDEMVFLLDNKEQIDTNILFTNAAKAREKAYGKDIFLRGLIEISNYCRNDCYYCGIRKSNKEINRFRLTRKEILDCCQEGYNLGFRSFVLQGGEDFYFTDKEVSSLVSDIKNKFIDCAVTLSLGERDYNSYQTLFKAGADRYLLRHETADSSHYIKLHTNDMNLKSRIACLENLKKIGYQVGCGFMVGSPFQDNISLAKDLCFIKSFKPHMIGIGPFIPHSQTPFANEKSGDYKLTMILLAITRLLLPDSLIPSTTALSTVIKDGWMLGLNAGANVLMLNLTPAKAVKNYLLYNNKVYSAANNIDYYRERLKEIGLNACCSRGDHNTRKEF